LRKRDKTRRQAKGRRKKSFCASLEVQKDVEAIAKKKRRREELFAWTMHLSGGRRGGGGGTGGARKRDVFLESKKRYYPLHDDWGRSRSKGRGSHKTFTSGGKESPIAGYKIATRRSRWKKRD